MEDEPTCVVAHLLSHIWALSAESFLLENGKPKQESV